MNKDKPVVKTHGDLVGCKWFGFYPIAHVVEQRAQINLNQMRCDAKIALACSIHSCPAPDFAKHAPVQTREKRLVGDLSLSFERPVEGFENVFRLKLV